MGNQQVSLDLIPIPIGNNYYCDVVGNIYSTNRGKLKVLSSYTHYGNKSRNPYKRVKLAGKLYLVHRLVLAAHLGRPLKRDELVNHLDGNGANNALSNLELVTHKQNVAHAKENGLYCSGREWYKARGNFRD